MAASTKDQCGPKEKNKQNFVPIVKCQTLGNNPAQKKQTKKSAKAKSAKSYLKAPFTYEWPKISESVGLEVVSLLKEMFSTHGLERQKCARGGKLLKEKKSSTDNEQVIEKWKCFVFGINAVTRCVEKGQSSLVLCDNSVQPNVLTTHLIEMCRHSGIPAASLPGLSSLAETLGFTSLTSLAFRELSHIKSEEFHKVVTTITNKIPKLIGPMDPKECPATLDHDKPPVVEDPEADEYKHKINLPPDDVDFSTLYVFKRDLSFQNQEEIISLGSTFKRKTLDNKNQNPTVKKRRYIPTEIGKVKSNPNRPNKSRKIKNKSLKKNNH